jgi:vancomycin resistance protein YoaR
MNNKLKKSLIWGLGIILLLLVFLSGSILFLEKYFSGQIYQNVYVNNINLSGLAPNEAEVVIRERVEYFDKNGFKISLNEREIFWYNLVSSFDPDLASQVVIFNVENTVKKAYAVSRGGDFFDYFIKLKLFFVREQVDLEFFIDEDLLVRVLKENFSDLENPAQDARIVFNEDLLIDSSNRILFYIEPENSGFRIDYDKFLNEFQNNVKFLNNKNINLTLVDDRPVLKAEDVKGLDFEAHNLLDLAPFNLSYEEGKRVFEVDFLKMASWMYLEPYFLNEKVVSAKVSLSQDEVYRFFDEKVNPEINREPVLPNFEFSGDRVVSFQPGKDGWKLNYEESFSNILESFEKRNLENVNLIVEVDPVEEIGDFNDLGIKEIIGTGYSSYAGSPVNRIHNIKTGANKLHGLIIKPGEEFSTVRAIGQVNAETGYLPELVIKGNKTIPEYGGGLCQVSTTIFRAALNTGLPITDRRNHSYRVSYYEPAGTDATIYTPNPDLKFINDTENNILIQVRFGGASDIYFDFWGTSDGREVSVAEPVIYNIVRPGPTQIIETTDLAPGEKKCTERAHSGADAYFDYSVIYKPNTENEDRIEKRFYSKYVPWREVCLVGVEKEISTTTEEIIEGDSNSENDINTSTPVVE